jgi:ubiquinone/menaquinone biosynthesis C-methylase UbiE
MLINPLRNLFENPHKLFGDLVHEGMTVLEPGCGMGYFTLPLARMVGESGRVIAIDIQPKMIAVLAKRALSSGLFDRIEMRMGESDRLKIEDLSGTVDFALALHMVHETANPSGFFKEIWAALKNKGNLLLIEPKGHVSLKDFDRTLAAAREAGFIQNDIFPDSKRRKALLQKKLG